MPPKELEHIDLTYGVIYLDGCRIGNIGKLETVTDLTPAEIPEKQEEWTKLLISRSMSCEFNCRIKNPRRLMAQMILLSTGNDLYVRFPKKLRRRRKRRCGNL